MAKTLWEVWRIPKGKGDWYAMHQVLFSGSRLSRDDVRSLDKARVDEACAYLNETGYADEEYFEVWDASLAEAKIALLGIEDRVYPSNWRRSYEFRADEVD